MESENVIFFLNSPVIHPTLAGGIITGHIRWDKALGLPIRRTRFPIGRQNCAAAFEVKAWVRTAMPCRSPFTGDLRRFYWKPLHGDISFDEIAPLNGQWAVAYRIGGIAWNSIIRTDVDLRPAHLWYLDDAQGYVLSGMSIRQASGPDEAQITPDHRVVTIDWELVGQD